MTPDVLDFPSFRQAHPLWDGDPWSLIPTTPLTDDEAALLRTCDGTLAELNRYVAEHRTIGLVAHALRHRPTGGVAFAMIRSSARMCSSTAALFGTGEVVPIQECNTRLTSP